MIATSKLTDQQALDEPQYGDMWGSRPSLCGVTCVRSQRVVIGEMTARLQGQEFPQVDVYAIRILLSETLPVARSLQAPDESLQLRYSVSPGCVKLRLEYESETGLKAAPWRLCRRRRRTFSQLCFLPLFSTAHWVDDLDGSLTFLRLSGMCDEHQPA